MYSANVIHAILLVFSNTYLQLNAIFQITAANLTTMERFTSLAGVANKVEIGPTVSAWGLSQVQLQQKI